MTNFSDSPLQPGPLEFDNSVSPFYFTADQNTEGEANLSPYCVLYGPGIYASPPDTYQPSDLHAADSSLLLRYALCVAPLQNDTYPNSAINKWLVNLDTQQLYSANPQSTNNYKFGKDYEAAAVVGDNCYDKYGTTDGVYSSPVPILGAPIEFRKVYFRGQSVDEYGKISGCVSGSGSSGCNTYFAYFACSQPVMQDCVPDDGDNSGCAYNPRNENIGIGGLAVNWEDFDIGCGGGSSSSAGGGGGCSNAFSVFSGGPLNAYAQPTSGYDATGCDTFTFRGQSGIAANISGSTLDITYTGQTDFMASGFAASGCLNIDINASTNTITYGASSGELLACLGYTPRSLTLITGDGCPTGAGGTGCCTIDFLVKTLYPGKNIVGCEVTTTTTTTSTTTTQAPCVTDPVYVCGVETYPAANGSYSAASIVNGKRSYTKSGHILKYDGAKWVVETTPGATAIAEADPGNNACPTDASWSSPVTVQASACPTTTTTSTTTTTTTTSTTTTTAALCSETNICVASASDGNGTYSQDGTFNGKRKYDLSSQYKIRWRNSSTTWEIYDTVAEGQITESETSTDACPSDASWPAATVTAGSC